MAQNVERIPEDILFAGLKPNGASTSRRAKNGGEQASVTHLELARLVERVNRRYVDLLRVDLNRLGVVDASPSQVMILLTIGDDELSVRDLLERGNYLGSNASYNLKHLADAGYIEREASRRDRRSARIRLAEKGRRLCAAVRRIDDGHHQLMVRDEHDRREMETAFRLLRRLEVTWTTTIRYGET